MANFRLVTDISKLGLLQGLARTRNRLILSTLCTLAATYALGIWSAHYVMEVSASVAVNVLLITGNIFTVLIASYLVTVLIGDLTFPGPWRETVFLDRGPGDLERAPVRDHSGEFLVILALAVLANGVGLNYVNGGFLERYHNVGYFQVRLRSDDPEERIAAYEDLTRDMNFALWEQPEIQKLILDGFDDPSPEVRTMAVWSAGTIDLQRARPELIDLMGSDPSPSVVAQSALALGKLGTTPLAREAIEEMLARADSPDSKVGALRALGLMGSRQSVERILPLLDSQNDDVMLHAFWALRKIGSEEARPAVRRIVDTQPPLLKQCAAYDALKKVATDEDMLWARRMYQTGTFDEECDERIWRERDGDKHRILIGDSFREKLLKIVANQAARDHRDWFQRIVNDPDADSRLREVASEVIRQLREAG